jgi:hypothetical protein
MSPGVNGSSLTPRERAGKAAAFVLNVEARRLVRAQVARGWGRRARVAAARPGDGTFGPGRTAAAVGTLVEPAGRVREPDRADAARARNPGPRIRRKGLCGRAACGWAAASLTGPG